MLISHEKAYQIVMKHVKPLSVETRELHQSLNYVLAEKIKADRDMPPAARSVMDGYALNLDASIKGASTFHVVGECPAGRMNRRRIKPGEAMRIFTGANIPPGANSVAIVEQAVEENGMVTIQGRVVKCQFIFKQGENARKGAILLDAGTMMQPHHVGICAAVGKSVVKVFPKPSILILSTGTEIKDIEDRITKYETRNSNAPMISAALEQNHFKSQIMHLPDDPSLLTKELEKAIRKFQFIISIGGVSKGNYDYIRQSILNLGGAIHYHGIRMKPGKPQLFARMNQHALFYGLPGNPLSSLVGCYEFVLPALKRMSGLDIALCKSTVQAKLSQTVLNDDDRARFYLGRLTVQDSQLWVKPISSNSSADIPACREANGTLIIPLNKKRLKKGEQVDFSLWPPSPFPWNF
ncbi:MAG: molybdopterin molybdotransferase MoeA [Candidatus Omnitrophica bacterium]|nr:molybdopterin molybdotransferase MoeA [Candidatus Omnitrophota bacterium]